MRLYLSGGLQRLDYIIVQTVFSIFVEVKSLLNSRKYTPADHRSDFTHNISAGEVAAPSRLNALPYTALWNTVLTLNIPCTPVHELDRSCRVFFLVCAVVSVGCMPYA
jgi:hypothetical protein